MNWKHVIPTFSMGLLMGVTLTMACSGQTQDVLSGPAPLHEESMVMVRQYEREKTQTGTWPTPDSIATYRTSFKKSETNQNGWRVDVFQISGDDKHALAIGLEPDGNGWFVETRYVGKNPNS